MRVSILKFDEPTINGRIYSEKETILKDKGFIYYNEVEYYPPTLDKAVGEFSNVEIFNNEVFCEIRLFDKIITPLDPSIPLEFTTSGLGILDKDNNVKEYKLSHINVTIGLME